MVPPWKGQQSTIVESFSNFDFTRLFTIVCRDRFICYQTNTCDSIQICVCLNVFLYVNVLNQICWRSTQSREQSQNTMLSQFQLPSTSFH